CHVQRRGPGRHGQGLRARGHILPVKTMNMTQWSLLLCVLLLLPVRSARAAEETWDYKKQFLPYLIDAVPKILETQNKQTGGFGKEPWICTDQNVIFPLAAAWAVEDSDNP